MKGIGLKEAFTFFRAGNPNLARKIFRGRIRLSDHEHFLSRQVITLSQKLNKTQKKVTSFKRLEKAEKLNASPNFSKLDDYVSLDTYNFILSQVRNQMVKPQVRRFKLEDKIMVLSLLKASGRGYNLLSKIFTIVQFIE